MILCTLLSQNGGGAVVAAIIATLVAGLGWLGKSILSGALHYLSVWGGELERLIALKAEITMNLSGQRPYTESADLTSRLRATYARDPGYIHFVPLSRENAVFDNIKKDITRLPEVPLQSVVDYYKASAVFDTLLASLETVRYEGLGTDRKIEIYAKATEFSKTLVQCGEKTLKQLDDEIHRRGVYRSLMVGGMICLAGLAGLGGLYAVRSQWDLVCASPKTASTQAAGQISGGRIGGLIGSSPSLRELSEQFYMDRAHIAINAPGKGNWS